MMESNAPYVTNLVNSIIGVSVLAMPFCMKKCGLLLGLGLLIGMSWLTYISCNMLVQSAVYKKRRTYEYLAFYTIGPSGKFLVELSMIGLMLGTCVAFYVIIGDLATQILSNFVGASAIQLRTYAIVFCALCVALPLGLMKNLSVLGFIGFFSLIFYCIFVCVMFANSLSSGLLTFDWIHKIELFKPSGVFQCLPIFGLAYACQCQLFVVYDSLENVSIMRMENIVVTSLKIVTSVYCMVAILGYQSFLDQVEGNVLKNFSPNVMLELIKLGFAVSVVVGFPLMIFPCRQSIHTLFFSKQPGDGIATTTYIEPFTFKAITLCIVLSTMMVAVFIPNVETILGLTGATMGSFICFIFPGIIFSKASPKGDTNISKFVLGIGCILLVVCTYSNVYSAINQSYLAPKQNLPVKGDVVIVPHEQFLKEAGEKVDEIIPEPTKPPLAEVVDNEHRHEPANPLPPDLEELKDGKEVAQEVANDGANDKPDSIAMKPAQEERDFAEDRNDPKQHNSIEDKEDDPDDKKDLERDVPDTMDQEVQNILPEKDLQSDNINPNQVETAEENVEENDSRGNMDHAEELAVKKEDVRKTDNSVDENELLDKIREQQKKQHELLEKQEKLIKALEDQHRKDPAKTAEEGGGKLEGDLKAEEEAADPVEKARKPAETDLASDLTLQDEKRKEPSSDVDVRKDVHKEEPAKQVDVLPPDDENKVKRSKEKLKEDQALKVAEPVHGGKAAEEDRRDPRDLKGPDEENKVARGDGEEDTKDEDPKKKENLEDVGVDLKNVDIQGDEDKRKKDAEDNDLNLEKKPKARDLKSLDVDAIEAQLT
ncbi:uncharacterized protein LOC143461847 [Clavelina lepadiformis]|uniref:uncharacterized protein LOC143461847 n=1 Tax=Clavelina lepadiformis TaxID=159417 RepID=UPI004041E25A